MNPKIKKIIIIVIVVILLGVAYSMFFKKEEAAPLGTTTGAPIPSAGTSAESQVGQEFLQVLLSLRSIKLDDSILTSPAFNTLQDYTLTLIPEGNEGRPNPFAPIGADLILNEGFLPALPPGSESGTESGSPGSDFLINQPLNF